VPNHSLALLYAKLDPWGNNTWDGYQWKNLVVAVIEQLLLDERGGT